MFSGRFVPFVKKTDPITVNNVYICTYRLSLWITLDDTRNNSAPWQVYLPQNVALTSVRHVHGVNNHSSNVSLLRYTNYYSNISDQIWTKCPFIYLQMVFCPRIQHTCTCDSMHAQTLVPTVSSQVIHTTYPKTACVWQCSIFFLNTRLIFK